MDAASQLCTHLGRKVLENSRRIHGCRGAHASMTRRAILQMPVDSSHGKLQENENKMTTFHTHTHTQITSWPTIDRAVRGIYTNAKNKSMLGVTKTFEYRKDEQRNGDTISVSTYLQTRPRRSGDRFGFRFSRVLACLSTSLQNK